ncbi:MAG: glycosyltransferase family 2 protein [Bacteroidales bacterium]|nr:glycosyltransferase family 2 protein [Bacteroidales bacterium]
MKSVIKYSFVVPAYNEEANIPALYERIKQLMSSHQNIWELIFVNDGSVDKTLDVLKNLTSEDKKIKYIDLSRNFGHQAALSAGLNHASGNAVISMDCDLQDPPEVIEKMIQEWKNGYQIVYARRKNFRKDNFLKKIGSKLYYRLMGRFTRIEIPRNVGDFRLVDKKVLAEINQMPEHSRYIRGMVAWTGFKHTFVDYHRPDRQKGESNYTLGKLAKLGMDGVFNFSMLPLRLGFLMGFISIISGFGLLLYQIIDVLITGAYYHLYKWLVVVLFIFMGFMFMLFWVIGEYIGKIYDDVRKRPLFVISEMKNFD